MKSETSSKTVLEKRKKDRPGVDGGLSLTHPDSLHGPDRKGAAFFFSFAFPGGGVYKWSAFRPYLFDGGLNFVTAGRI